jgi:DedD protein
MSENPDALLLKKRARRRLIGVVALVLFIVIVLPMVLDKEPKPLQNELSVQIPRQDSGGFKTRVLPQTAVSEKVDSTDPVKTESLPSEVAGKKSESPAQKLAPAKKTEMVPAIEPSPKADVKASPAMAKPGADAQAAQALLNDEVWGVPLGTFSNPGNVKQLQSKLEAVGVKSVTEVLKTKDGEKIRVLGGPFKNKSDAEKARETLKAAGLDVGAVTVR